MNNKTSIDLSTIFGISTTLIIILFSITSSSNISAFIDYYSIFIVLIGTFLVTSACFSVSQVIRAHVVILNVIINKVMPIQYLATQSIKLAESAKKNGIITFENKIFKEKGQDMLKRAFTLWHQGKNILDIEEILEEEIMANIEENENTVLILKKSAEIAPAMGLIGTLMGLVQMLGNLSDASNLGPSMAIALLTTFYGAVLSYILFFPLASKIEHNLKIDILVANINIKTVISILKSENPRYLESSINALLPYGQKIIHY